MPLTNKDREKLMLRFKLNWIESQANGPCRIWQLKKSPLLHHCIDLFVKYLSDVPLNNADEMLNSNAFLRNF